MTSSIALSPGRLLFVLSNLFYTIGAFVADFSDSHVYNPLWPPHAKFHNGQTISLSVLLALASIYLVFCPTSTRDHREQNIFMAAVIGSFYCASGVSAILYPNTDWMDNRPRDKEGPGGQFYIFSFQVMVIWTAYALETRSIRNEKIA